MDREKRMSKFLGSSKMYLDLKDIIRENALHFLPAKSALKFRAVCTDWKLWISTPFFAHNQTLSFKGVSGIFCQSPGHPPSFIPLTPESFGVPDPSLGFLPEPVTIRSSSNGLICCQGHTGYNAYYVCNPVTKKWVKLPKQSANHGPNPPIVLVFEPSLLNFVVEFKLICPFPSEDFESAMEFDIYSSSQGSWKISPEICFASTTVAAGTGFHVKGVVYWKSSEIEEMVVYDLKKDKYGVKYYACDDCNFALGEMNGKLCLVYLTGSSTLNVTHVQTDADSSMTTIGSDYYDSNEDTTTSFTLDSKAIKGVGYYQRLKVILAAQDMVCVRNVDTITCYDMMKNETKVVGTASGTD